MITRFLSAADRAASPWKNGGGVTREVAVWPEGAGVEAFDWRVSIAEVREPGAFSPFPEVDRCLTVLRGALSLSLGETAVILDPWSEPLNFSGDHPCHGSPVGGPVLDLNVMCRRGRFNSQVERICDTSWRPSGQTAILVAIEPLAVGAESLNTFDSLIFTDIDRDAAPALHVGGRAIVIALNSL